jgi:predicted dehydrogenase
MFATSPLMPSATRRDTIRVGVVGTGFGAAVHIPALKKVADFDVVAVCSRHPERAHLAAAQHGIQTAVSDFRELMRNPDVDAVVIATPPFLHHSMVIAALEEGKHVLCEKPMAKSVAESRDMVKIAERVRVTAMVNHEFRFVPARARAKELIDEGYIGEPQSASLTIYRSSLNDPNGIPFGWLMESEKAGGMLGAAGSHHVDALRWWFGEVKSVAGAVGTMVRRRRLPESTHLAAVDADDNFAILLKFANGAIATVHYSATAVHDPVDQIILSGSEGMLVVGSDGRLFGARRRETLSELPLPDRLSVHDGEFDHPLVQPTILLMREWASAIRTGVAHSPSFDDGVKIQEILDAVQRSSQQGRWVDVNRSRWQIA